MHNEYKRRVHSQNGLQLLLRGVLFGERRGSKVKGHSSFVNIRTGLPRYSTSLDDLHSTLSIMGILLSLKTHVKNLHVEEFRSNGIISKLIPKDPFSGYFKKKKEIRCLVDYIDIMDLTKKGNTTPKNTRNTRVHS